MGTIMDSYFKGLEMFGWVSIYPRIEKIFHHFRLAEYVVTSPTGHEEWLIEVMDNPKHHYNEYTWLKPILGGKPTKCTITAFVVDKPIVELVKY